MIYWVHICINVKNLRDDLEAVEFTLYKYIYGKVFEQLDKHFYMTSLGPIVNEELSSAAVLGFWSLVIALDF